MEKSREADVKKTFSLFKTKKTESIKKQWIGLNYLVFRLEIQTADFLQKRRGRALMLKLHRDSLCSPGGNEFGFGQILNSVIAAFDVDIWMSRLNGF